MTRSGEKVIQYVFHIWYSCVSELSFGSLYQADGKCVYTVHFPCFVFQVGTSDSGDNSFNNSSAVRRVRGH